LLVAATIATRVLWLVFHRPPTRRFNKEHPGIASDSALAAKGETLRFVAWRSSHEPYSTGKPVSVAKAISDGARFRIQFLGGANGQGPAIVKELKVCALNTFSAVRLADLVGWPPGANGFRVLDGAGHDVFWRRKPERLSVEQKNRQSTAKREG